MLETGLFIMINMLKKKLGVEAIERDWARVIYSTKRIFKIPTTLIIPEGCRRIGKSAFWKCKIKEVVIPEGVVVIEYRAFEDCWELKKVNIPEGCEKIKEWAFYDCESLKKVIIPGSVEVIGDYAFCDCKVAEITVEKPESKRYISSTAFLDCRDVEEEVGN